MKEINWKNVYELPFHNDLSCDIYVKDSNNKTVFNKTFNDIELSERLIGKLNGFNNDKFNATIDGNWISIDNRRMLLIRGWGRLTGTSALSLSSKEACNIQNEFGKWVVSKLIE